MSDFEDRMAQLRDRFRSGCAERERQIEEAVGHGDFPAIAAAAHGIVGTAGIFGFTRLSQAAASLEQQALAKPDLQLVRERAAAIIAELQRVSRSRD